MGMTLQSNAQFGAQQLVDLAHLARQTLGNPELEQEILRLFHRQSAIYGEKVINAACRKDCLEAAHTLKGSAKGVGAWSVADAAEKVEQANGNAETPISDLQQAIDQTRNYINSLLVAA
jgi:HPt (histidine-containing phosphotransfer) domain-containing protein